MMNLSKQIVNGQLTRLFLTPERFSSVWSHVKMGPPDVIFGITEAFKLDKNPMKINLGAGTYRDDNGKPFVLPSVKEAEKRMMSKNLDKEYAEISGIPEFRSQAFKLAIGKNSPILGTQRNATVQSISGTGALSIAGTFLSTFSEHKDIWLPTPTWGNHKAIFNASNLNVHEYRYYDAQKCGFDQSGCLLDLGKIPKGHAVLLHACAHNPTGVDPSPEQWREMASIIKSRELIPIFDFAYQGFASGDVDRDAMAIRLFADEFQFPSLFMTQSFAKNMGLYGERVGSLTLISSSAEEAERCLSQLKILIRSRYSNPPIHGARIATEILSDADLRSNWLIDVKSMADRIISMRHSVVKNLAKEGSNHDWSHIINQIGMFCFTGLSPAQVDRLTKEFSIYLTRDGRVSIASLTSKNVEYFSRAVHEVTK